MAYDDVNITVVGGPTAKVHYDQVFDNTVALKEGLIMHDLIGIGTTPVPHGGIGIGIFAVEGPDSDADGPHVQMTTDSDDYPLFQQYMWSHDSMGLAFDAYYDGADWKSADAGSSFLILKASDALTIYVDSGVAQGANSTWTLAMAFTNDGRVGIGTGAVDASALLELDSTTGALLLPRMTTGQRDALGAVNGMLIYNSTNNKIEGYENGAWVDI